MKLKRRLLPHYEERQTLDVRGIARTYWVAPEPFRPPCPATPDHDRPPLLLGFHGLGSSGSRMAWWTGLGICGPRAGFLCVFPDALDTIWDDHGCGRRDGADDIAFVTALVDHLTRTGAADPDRLFLAGVSSGATFLERFVRSGATQVRGMALVAGTARVANTLATPISTPRTHVLIVAGTDDPMTPYEGGLPRGSMGRIALQRVHRLLLDPSGHESVPPEALAAEWARVNGCLAVPSVELLDRAPGTHPVTRLTWVPKTPAGCPVVLYRIDGGGHGWPGAKQYLPARLIGRIPEHLDGNAIVLEFARGVAGLVDTDISPA
jgi:polyhydroxybutyrate depolymerase